MRSKSQIYRKATVRVKNLRFPALDPLKATSQRSRAKSSSWAPSADAIERPASFDGTLIRFPPAIRLWNLMSVTPPSILPVFSPGAVATVANARERYKLSTLADACYRNREERLRRARGAEMPLARAWARARAAAGRSPPGVGVAARGESEGGGGAEAEMPWPSAAVGGQPLVEGPRGRKTRCRAAGA